MKRRSSNSCDGFRDFVFRLKDVFFLDQMKMFSCERQTLAFFMGCEIPVRRTKDKLQCPPREKKPPKQFGVFLHFTGVKVVLTRLTAAAQVQAGDA